MPVHLQQFFSFSAQFKQLERLLVGSSPLPPALQSAIVVGGEFLD